MSVKMALSNNIMDFVERFQALQSQRDTSDELIKDLLVYCERVERRLRDENKRLANEKDELKLDLEDAKKARRDFQQRALQAESLASFHSDANDSLKNRNPYVLILIDGDGLIFQEHYVRQGIEGGKRAAYALRAAVAEQCGKHADETEIIAKICSNISGLSNAMYRHGCVGTDNDLKNFTLGFNQAKASFDFVDVGYGKERADSKIREITRWNLRNNNCKQILLGVSHDAGYAPFLDEVLQDEGTRSRITLLEGVPTVRELRNTGVNIMQFEHLFRHDKLVSHVVTSRSGSFGHAQRASTPSTSSSSGPGTWATVTGNASPPPQLKLPLANKSGHMQPRPQAQAQVAPKSPTPAWDPGPRGLDLPINVSQTVLENIKKRKDSSKLCNNHYLRGPCVKGSDCCFDHKYKPNAEEINAIAYLARLNPCTKGQDCDLENCIYGHHCPCVKDGVCTHPYCKFRVEEHPPDTRFKNAHIRDN